MARGRGQDCKMRTVAKGHPVKHLDGTVTYRISTVVSLKDKRRLTRMAIARWDNNLSSLVAEYIRRGLLQDELKEKVASERAVREAAEIAEIPDDFLDE